VLWHNTMPLDGFIAPWEVSECRDADL